MLVGAGTGAADLMSRIAHHPETGLRVRGVLGADRAWLPGLPSVGDVAMLPDLIDSGAIDTVIVGDASSEDELRVIQALAAVRRVRPRSTSCHGCPSSRCRPTTRCGASRCSGSSSVARGLRMGVKRASDVVLASLALVASAR